MTLNSLALETKGGYSLTKGSLCHGYPKVSVNTPEGMCVGLVASEEDGLKRPRRILALGNDEFIITDMVGWVANRGIVWRFNSRTKTLEKVFTGVDHAHGLALGPDGLVYIGTREGVFRFDPNHELPQRESIISNLPKDGNHPLTHFIFDEEGNLLVNVGAPSDQCLDESGKAQYPCPESEGDNPEAVIRKYTKESAYRNYSIIARGLRNSMAMAIEPLTGQLFQGENGMDFKELETPKEEINLIEEGKHYGWPYCFEDGKLNPKYKRTFFNRRIPHIDCTQYQSPVAHLPPHSAPLDMMFYQGEMFKELQGKLIVSLHGYRETGHRIVSLDLSEQFLPVESSKIELVNEWTTENTLTPRGAPVGMTIDSDGSIWLVEDKNKTILVIAKGDSSSSTQDQDQERKTITWDKLSLAQKNTFSELNDDIFQQSCLGCHSQFQGKEDLVFDGLIESGFILPGEHKKSPLYYRMTGTENGNLMPLGGEPVSESHTDKLKQFIDALK